MAALETDVLAELIRAKLACLVQLRDMGRRQHQLIEGGEMTALLDVLAAKQRSLVKLQQIERALDPFRNQDPEGRRWRSPQDRDACAEHLQQCETLLFEIVTQEKRCEAALICRRDDAATRLQGAHLAGEARGAYTTHCGNSTNQLDLLSDT